MSLLIKRFREEAAKNKDYRVKAETEMAVSYPTMFLNFDFANGAFVLSQNKVTGEDESYYSIGIPDGSMNMVIGRSGCGKTTFTFQVASNIIRPFKTSALFEDNIEGGLQDTRRMMLSKFDESELKERIITRDTGITAENFYERIKMIHDIKVNNRADFEYDTGKFDSYGERIYKLEPTVYMLDSLALLMPSNLTEEEVLSGSMSATAAAKTNASVFKRVIPMLKSANIILFVINHINQKVEINMFARSKAQVSYLKQGETLPGGNTPIYLSNNIFRFDDNAKLSSEKEFGIDGAIVDVTFVKSRTNRAGQVVTLLFDQVNGFDPDLSLYLMLKQLGKIKGAGAYLYLDGHPDYKFSQKKFKETLCMNDDFRNIFMQMCLDILKESLARTPEDIADLSYNTAESMLEMLNVA